MTEVQGLAFISTPAALMMLGWGVAIWARHYAK